MCVRIPVGKLRGLMRVMGWERPDEFTSLICMLQKGMQTDQEE